PEEAGPQGAARRCPRPEDRRARAAAGGDDRARAARRSIGRRPKKLGRAARSAGADRAVMMAVVEERCAQVGIAPLCAALGLSRATFYRHRGGPRPRRAPRQALTPMERDGVLALLHEEQFVDLAPSQVWAQLLDAGQVPPCSIRTMYRVLDANAEVRERRNQLRHPAYHKPELLA